MEVMTLTALRMGFGVRPETGVRFYSLYSYITTTLEAVQDSPQRGRPASWMLFLSVSVDIPLVLELFM